MHLFYLFMIEGENNQIQFKTHQEAFLLVGCCSSSEELMSAVSIMDKSAKWSGLIKKKKKNLILLFSVIHSNTTFPSCQGTPCSEPGWPWASRTSSAGSAWASWAAARLWQTPRTPASSWRSSSWRSSAAPSACLAWSWLSCRWGEPCSS